MKARSFAVALGVLACTACVVDVDEQQPEEPTDTVQQAWCYTYDEYDTDYDFCDPFHCGGQNHYETWRRTCTYCDGNGQTTCGGWWLVGEGCFNGCVNA